MRPHPTPGDQRSAAWRLAREVLAVRDAASLAPALPGLLWRAPRGDGAPALVLPGYMTSDRSTAGLRWFLGRLGYRVAGWGLGVNRGDLARLVPAVLSRAEALAGAAGQPLRVVGWSLGGALAREIALRRPALVDRVDTMGTPVVGGPKYTFAARAYRDRGHDLDALARAADARLRSRTLTRDVLAIYSRGDGVVEWRACLDPHNARVEHVEVRAAHVGLGFHPEVYRLVAAFLAR